MAGEEQVTFLSVFLRVSGGRVAIMAATPRLSSLISAIIRLLSHVLFPSNSSHLHNIKFFWGGEGILRVPSYSQYIISPLFLPLIPVDNFLPPVYSFPLIAHLRCHFPPRPLATI